MSKRESWPAFKERHLVQVAEGPLLPPTAYRLDIILVSYLNSRTYEAFPSERTLADRLGYDVGANEPDPKCAAGKLTDAKKMIRRARDALVAAEHWKFGWRDGHLFYTPICQGTAQSPGGDNTVPDRGQHSPARGTAQSPKPEKEPEKEPPDLRPENYGLPKGSKLVFKNATDATFLHPDGHRVPVKRRSKSESQNAVPPA